MKRIGLQVTDPDDLPFIYQRLRSLTAPAKVHIDDSEIVTGVIPLPTFENGTVALRSTGTGRAYAPGDKPGPTTTLNWTDALSVTRAWNREEDSPEATPPFIEVTGNVTEDTPSCHVAVVGASEGEAVMLANWVHRHRTDLEKTCSVAVTGISWVATDIAPVGHMVVGTLTALPVAADTWAVVATSTRLKHCRVTGLITETLKWSELPHVLVAIDRSEDNVERPEDARLPKAVDIEDLVVAIDLREHPPLVHPGGLFQWQLPEALL